MSREKWHFQIAARYTVSHRLSRWAFCFNTPKYCKNWQSMQLLGTCCYLAYDVVSVAFFNGGIFPFRVVPYQATTFPAGASTASWNVGHWDSAENGCEHFVTDGIDGIPIFVAHFGEIHWGGFHSHSVFCHVCLCLSSGPSCNEPGYPGGTRPEAWRRYDEIRNSREIWKKKVCKFAKTDCRVWSHVLVELWTQNSVPTQVRLSAWRPWRPSGAFGT